MTQNLTVALMLIHRYVNGAEIIGVEDGDLSFGALGVLSQKNEDQKILMVENVGYRRCSESKERYTTLRPT